MRKGGVPSGIEMCSIFLWRLLTVEHQTPEELTDALLHRPNLNSSMRSFVDYIMDNGGIDERPATTESFNRVATKIAVTSTLTKMPQLRQQILQDRTSSKSEKTIATMLSLNASLLTAVIALLTRDAELANRAHTGLY